VFTFIENHEISKMIHCVSFSNLLALAHFFSFFQIYKMKVLFLFTILCPGLPLGW